MPDTPSRWRLITLSILALALILVWTAAAHALPASTPIYLPLIQHSFNPPPLQLLITEIMAYPSGDEPEWVEIYNPNTAAVDLSGYKVGDEESIGGPEAMRQFPAGAAIQPGEVLVLALDANAFKNVYGFLPDYEIVNTGSPVPDLFDYVPWANGPFSLANAGDELLLLNFYDDLVDAVAWGDSTWDGFTPAANPGQGSTLERFPANQDTGAAADWREQPQPQPGVVDLSLPLPTPTPTPTPTPFGGGLFISEVVYNPTGEEPNGEWFEIYNATGQALSLASFKIGDEETSGGGEGAFQFPAGSLAQPGAAIVIANRAADFQSVYGFAPDFELTDTDPAVPDMVEYVTWSSGNISLANTGDDLLLLDYYDTVVDALSWGSAAWAFDPAVPNVLEGHSIERVPAVQDTDTAADWQDQPVPGPGAVSLTLPTPTMTPTPFTGLLLISEVVYDPTSPEPDAEWIEIFNATGGAVSLSNFKIGDEENQDPGADGMYRFPDGETIADGEVIIIANQAMAFLDDYGFKPDYELNATDPDVPDMIKYTAWSSGIISLHNDGDELLLLDAGDNLVDAVAWGSSNWTEFTPGVPDVPAGHSIERVPADLDTDSNTDWVGQPAPDPGNVTTGL